MLAPPMSTGSSLRSSLPACWETQAGPSGPCIYELILMRFQVPNSAWHSPSSCAQQMGASPLSIYNCASDKQSLRTFHKHIYRDVQILFCARLPTKAQHSPPCTRTVCAAHLQDRRRLLTAAPNHEQQCCSTPPREPHA